jgi:hypothetical protein
LSPIIFIASYVVSRQKNTWIGIGFLALALGWIPPA